MEKKREAAPAQGEELLDQLDQLRGVSGGASSSSSRAAVGGATKKDSDEDDSIASLDFDAPPRKTPRVAAP